MSQNFVNNSVLAWPVGFVGQSCFGMLGALLFPFWMMIILTVLCKILQTQYDMLKFG